VDIGPGTLLVSYLKSPVEVWQGCLLWLWTKGTERGSLHTKVWFHGRIQPVPCIRIAGTLRFTETWKTDLTVLGLHSVRPLFC